VGEASPLPKEEGGPGPHPLRGRGRGVHIHICPEGSGGAWGTLTFTERGRGDRVLTRKGGVVHICAERKGGFSPALKGKEGEESLRQGADPPPLPLRVATADKNHLNKEIIPLLPIGIGELYYQKISNS
jgi:hypothetical protein